MRFFLRLTLFLSAFSIFTAQAQMNRKDQRKKSEQYIADLQRATTYKNNGQYDDAIQIYTKYIDEGYDPLENGFDYWFRGDAYFLKNDFDLSIRDYSELIRQHPKVWGWHYGRGKSYYGKGELDSALSDFNEDIRRNSKFGDAYLWRAKIYFSKGDYLQSIKEYETCFSLSKMKIYDEMSIYYIDIIFPLIRTLNFTGAKKYYDLVKETEFGKKILTEEKFSVLKNYLLAVTEFIPNEKFEESLNLLNDALKKTGYVINAMFRGYDNMFSKTRVTNILTLKGYVLEKLNKPDEAKDTYNQALVINTNQPDVKQALIEVEKKLAIIRLSDKTPPTIEIISPPTTRSFDIESDDGKTQLIGRASDASGIASIKINGKSIDKIEEDGLFITELSLKPGDNPIVITADDKQGNEASQTFNITGITAVSNKEPDNPIIKDAMPNYFAILIAEKDYTDPAIPDLQNPVKDARELKSILESQYTFNAANIDTLFNRSREEIMQNIVQRCNTLTDNDNLVIFYAGHGTAERDKFGDVDGYWIPVSAKRGLIATYISAEDINKAVKRSNAKHILLIADACFSGAFTRQLPPDAGKAIEKQYKIPSRKVMASGNLEPVPDNSRFLYYLKKTLMENAEKYVTAKKIFDSFYEAILNNTENLPQYAAIKNVGDEGGEFVFIRK